MARNISSAKTTLAAVSLCNFFGAGRICRLPRTVAANVILVVDESSSLQNVHRWLPTLVISLENQLKMNDLGTNAAHRNMYGLVGFGRLSPSPKAHVLLSNSSRPMYPAEKYPEANAKLVSYGRTEDGYQAIDFALTKLPFSKEPNVARVLILVSDEDRDVIEEGKNISRGYILNRLHSLGFILHVVVDNSFSVEGRQAYGVDSNMSAYGLLPNGTLTRTWKEVKKGKAFNRTNEDYTELALNLSGSAFDIKHLPENSSVIKETFTSVLASVISRSAKMQVQNCRGCLCNNHSVVSKRCAEKTGRQDCTCCCARLWVSETRV